MTNLIPLILVVGSVVLCLLDHMAFRSTLAVGVIIATFYAWVTVRMYYALKPVAEKLGKNANPELTKLAAEAWAASPEGKKFVIIGHVAWSLAILSSGAVIWLGWR